MSFVVDPECLEHTDDAMDQMDWTGDLGFVGQITSFGRDSSGEVYVVTNEGSVLKIVPLR